MADRLRARTAELNRSVLDRLHGMAGGDTVRSAEYLSSLTTAVQAGVGYGIEVIAVGEERAGDFPIALLAQARSAARHRVPLELVVRRYSAAERQLAHFAHREAADLDSLEVGNALADLSAAAERLAAIASEEYAREEQPRLSSHEARLVERTRRLLAGELVDPSLLDYDLDGHHLGLVARSAEARPLLRRLGAECGCRSLVLAPSPEQLWAWLGRGSAPIDADAVRAWLAANASPELPIGVGEPKSGRSGWRLTHRQANDAVWVAHGQGAPFAEYPQAALLGSLGRDPLLTTSLYEGYLLPLTAERDGGEALRRTLRAYFRANRNATSAGSSIGVSRQTVSNRVRLAERYLGQRLEDCGLILEVALELEEIGCFTNQSDSRS